MRPTCTAIRKPRTGRLRRRRADRRGGVKESLQSRFADRCDEDDRVVRCGRERGEMRQDLRVWSEIRAGSAEGTRRPPTGTLTNRLRPFCHCRAFTEPVDVKFGHPDLLVRRSSSARVPPPGRPSQDRPFRRVAFAHRRRRFEPSFLQRSVVDWQSFEVGLGQVQSGVERDDREGTAGVEAG